MRAIERRARHLLECFQGVGEEARRSSALVFLHELSEPEWEGSAPPPGHDWEQIASAADENLGGRLEAAMHACRRCWPGQVFDHDDLFEGIEGQVLRAAVVATEELTREPSPAGRCFGGRAEFLSEVYMSTRGRSAQSARGEYYTPMNVAAMMGQISGPAPGEWVIDPSCGTGHLLLGAIEELRCANGAEAVRTLTLIGVDISVQAVEICRLQMLLAGADADQFQIFAGDSLTQSVVGRAADGELHCLEFHCTLSNPPFGKRTANSKPGVEAVPLIVADRVLNRQIRVPVGLREGMLERGVVREVSRRAATGT